MPEPTPSAGTRSERRSRTGVRARSTGWSNPEKNGASCCATITPDILVGRSTTTIRSCCSKMPIYCARKSARGGRALLTGLMRCGRCGRMMRVFYGSRAGHAHRYQCRGNSDTEGGKMCLGAGGVRIDRAVAEQLLQAVSGHAIEAAIQAEG